MSIFGIIAISLLPAFLVILIGFLTTFDNHNEDIKMLITFIIAVVVFLASIFIGIGLNTENAKVWSANFEAQKTTIEQSLDSETLSGFERIELVNKAAELNGELAERKFSSELWNYVYYDKDVYKNIEPIRIK